MTTPVTARTLAKRQQTTAKNRRADAALLRTVGTVEAILLARDEATAVRRASVALGLPLEPEDIYFSHWSPAVVSEALTAWYRLRGPEPERLHVDRVASCACGKPVVHLDADPDSAEWACRVPS